MTGEETLASLADQVLAGEIDPDPASGGQEMLENRVNSVVWNVEA